jgi:hypothetical protein
MSVQLRHETQLFISTADRNDPLDQVTQNGFTKRMFFGSIGKKTSTEKDPLRRKRGSSLEPILRSLNLCTTTFNASVVVGQSVFTPKKNNFYSKNALSYYVIAAN